MEYNKYTVFLAVARLGSISAAAAALGYTQSGISHTIRRLEEETELTLFDRGRSGVTLTSAGRELLPLINQLEQCRENLAQTVQSLHNIHQGTLNIGTYSSISRNWLPYIIQNFQKDYPSITIHFKEGGYDEILRWLQNREVDIGFLSKYELENLEWIPLIRDPLMAVLPADQAAADPAFPSENFNGQTFIISARGIDIDVHKMLETSGISPDIRYSAQDDYTILSMVACHLGISILPQLVLDQNRSDLRYLPLQPAYTRELGIAIPSSEYASPAAREFIRYAELYVAENFSK